MKTLNYFLFTLGSRHALAGPYHPSDLQDNGTAPADEESASKRPRQSDGTSLKLIRNYLVASGGEDARKAVLNIAASELTNSQTK